MFIKLEVVGGGVVGGVEVICVGGELGGKSVDSLDEWCDAKGFSKSSDLALALVTELGYVQVGESSLFRRHNQVLVELLERSVLDPLVDADNVFEFIEVPPVDLGQVVQLFDTVVQVQHGMGDGKQTSVVIFGQSCSHVGGFPVGVESGKVGVNLSNGFLKRLFKRSTDSHDFADRLHCRSDITVDVLELGQIPLWYLCNDVVEGGFEASSGGFSHGIG